MGFFAPILPFGVSVALGVINLGFILFFLPESLPQDITFDQPSKLSFEDVKKTIYSTISIFSASHQMAFLGLALFLYSLTSASNMIEYVVSFNFERTERRFVSASLCFPRRSSLANLIFGVL